MDGSVKFNRDWADYVFGFGSVWGEQWLGLEKIHCLTTRTARTEMRIDMADFRGDKKYAYYNFFMVGNAASKYKLQVADRFHVQHIIDCTECTIYILLTYKLSLQTREYNKICSSC